LFGGTSMAARRSAAPEALARAQGVI